MAPPAQIREVLPETLPEDFVQWDEASTPAQAAQSPDAEPGPGVVSKPATEAAEVHRAADPSGNLPHAAALSVSVPDTRGRSAFWPKKPSLNAVSRSSRDTALPLHAAAPALDELRSAAPRPNRAAAATMAGFPGILLVPLRANAVEITKVARQKWMMIAGAGAAVLVVLAAGTMLLLNSGRAPSAEPSAVPVSQTGTRKQPDQATPSHADSTLTVPASATATPSPAPAQISPEAARRPAQKNAGLSREMMDHQLHTPPQLHVKASLPEPASLQAGGFDASDIHGLDNNNAIGAAFASRKEPRVQIASQQVNSSKRNVDQVASHQGITVPPGVALSLLVQHTRPVYPVIAKSAGISGTVVLAAAISTAGTVENLRVVSGPEVLRKSAVDAVRTWRFKPYMLNNQPTAIETTINLHFSIN
jgi:TonB family protein